MSNLFMPRVSETYVADALYHLKTRNSIEDCSKSALKAISSDQNVIDAFRDLLDCIRDPNLEPNLYDSMCALCNHIMAALAIHAPLKMNEVLIFRQRSSEMVKGDLVYDRFKPDILGVVSSRKDLSRIVAMPKHERDQYNQTGSHSPLAICGAEIKTAHKSKCRLLNYLVNMKLHHPDLAILHGFHFEENHFTMYSHDAGGMISSKKLKARKLTNWIAHVVLVYQALQDRDASLRGVPQEAFGRWDLTLDGITIPLAPFHIGTVPGRGTWVALQVDAEAGPERSRDVTQAYYTKAPVGFVKVSWQDVKGNFHEGELLDVAHGFRKFYASDIVEPENANWIPGLVRHLHYRRYSDENDPTIGLSGGVQRQRELLWLGSVGQPLSQCESLDHLFRVMFDALGVSLHMAERGIIHRDMSWFNILCKPKHDPKTLAKCPTIDHRPCIDYILSNEERPVLAEYEPCALITDLDHSAVIETIESEEYKPRIERTGTPLFIALELSRKRPHPLESRLLDLENLVKRFKHLESAYPDPFSRAFPDGNTEFLRRFSAVIAKEKTEYESGVDVCTNPTEPNRLHHDAEGIWWAMMWGLFRAAPINEKGEYIKMDADNSEDRSEYSKRCSHLLDHRPGDEESRASCITSPKTYVMWYLHTLLKTPAKVLVEIATYLTVPWHRYVDQGDVTRTVTVRRDHAHQAMRRLLLLAILEERGNPIPFSTSAPRTFDPQHGQDREKSTTLSGFQGTGISSEVVQVAPAPATANTRSSVKRSHADAFDAGASDVGASDAEDVHEDCDFEENSDDGWDDPDDGGYQDESENTTQSLKKAKLTEIKDQYEVPGSPNPDSVFDWIDKFHVDTVKWFGTGH